MIPRRRIHAVGMGLVLAGTGFLWAVNGAASPHGGGVQTTTGVVYTQGLVLEDGDGGSTPSFAEYDPDSGDYLQSLPGYDASDDSLWLSSGKDIEANAEAYLDLYNSLSSEVRANLEVVDVETFKGYQYPAGLDVGEPYERSNSLLVYRPGDYLLDETVQIDASKGVIVYESRYDLDMLAANSTNSSTSVLLDGDGKILTSSYNTIGYRVAYIDPDSIANRKGDKENERGASYQPGDDLVAPITDAWITNGMSLNGRFGVDGEGRYESTYVIPPCPGFSYFYTIPHYAAIPYRTFNPQREGSRNHYLFASLSGYTCSGAPFYTPQPTLEGNLAYLNAHDIYVLNQSIPTQAHFQVDVTLISGSFTLYNEYINSDGGLEKEPVVIGDETRYQGPPDAPGEGEEYVVDESIDYNGDGSADHVSEPGTFDDTYLVEVENEENAPLFGVWFEKPEGSVERDNGVLEDEEGEIIEPDLIRVADRKPNFEAIGLLESISAEDLVDTDIYVFRESTGELVMEKEPYSTDADSPVNGVDVDAQLGFFEVAIPGSDGRQSFGHIARSVEAEAGQNYYEAWQASLGVTEELLGDVDSIRVGEPLKVVLINRPTGYIGTYSTSVEAATDRSFKLQLDGEIELTPPNLKVHVQRQYEVEHGLSAGETRNYRIGAQGAALNSDQFVRINTEWVDKDGTPLPSQLPGYTGRFASLIGNGLLSSTVGEFPIDPGTQTNVVKLPNGGASVTAAHQYLHVSGKSEDQGPDFSRDPSGTYPYRPGRYVPLQVAIYDEEKSRELKASQTGDTIEQDSSVYRYVYRPEMSYSVYDLEVYRIDRVIDEETSVDVENAERPVIGVGDQSLNLTQYIKASPYDPLSYFGPEPDLIYNAEGYEQLAGTGLIKYEFNDLGFIGSLEPEDYLSLNLINNQDGGNILWEWAFEYLAIDARILEDERLVEDGTLVVSADELPIEILAVRFGGDREEDQFITWEVLEGDAQVTEGTRQKDDGKGIWKSTLDIEPVDGNEVLLQGRLGDDESSASEMRKVLVTPGVPAVISMDLQGGAYMLGHGQINVTITVQDAHGNMVDDGTPVGLSISEGGLIEGENLTTQNGVATAVIKGGEDPVQSAELVATVGELSASSLLNIEPLNIALSGLGAQHFRGESSTVNVTVTAGGAPASGVPVDLVATHGAVGEYTAVTDGQGVVSVPVLHLRPGEGAQLTAIVGVDISESASFDVAYRDDGDRRLETVETMVLGDQTTENILTHERYDGVVLEYSSQTRSPFSIQGNPAETVSMTLGDLSDPNLAPMAAWSMSTLETNAAPVVYHDADLAPGDVSQIVADSTQFSLENGFSMNVMFTPAAVDEQDGEAPEPALILDMAGAYQLYRSDDGIALLDVLTTEGVVSFESIQNLTGAHRVEARLLNGVLSFIVDDVRQDQDIGLAKLQYLDATNYSLSAPIDHSLQVASLQFDTPAMLPVPTAVALDDTELHLALTSGVTLINDNPMGVGTGFNMAAGGDFVSSLGTTLMPSQGLGFRTDIKIPDQLNAGSLTTILDYAGAMELAYADDGRLQLSVKTTDESYTLQSSTVYTAPSGPVNLDVHGNGTLSPGRWHTIAVRYINSELMLSVDGVVDTLQVTGDLVYESATSGNHELTLQAPMQTVRYNSFRIYDWNTEPLLVLLEQLSTDDSSATGTKTVVLDSAGRTTLDIKSLGNLNNQQVNSSIDTLRVALVSGDARDYVTVVSTEYYENISAFYLEHVAEGLPPIQSGSLGFGPGSMMIGALNFVVPPAQAGVLGFFWGAFNFLIPIEDVGILIKQLYYLATSNSKFDRSELIASALGTLTIIPLAKPLKPFIPGLKTFMKLASRIRPSFFKSAPGPLGRAVKNAFRGKTDDIILWLPMIYVMGEMVVDPEARESLIFLVNTISSENDLMAWVRYLSMPTDGWEGEGVPTASVGDSTDQASLDSNDGFGISSFFINEAKAVSVGARIGKAKLNNIIRHVRANGAFKNGADGDEFRTLMNAIDSIPKALSSAKASLPRKMGHSPQILSTAVALGGRGMKNFGRNADNLRVNSVIFSGVLAYLYSRRDCLVGDSAPVLYTGCKTFPEDLTKSLDTKLLFIATKLAILNPRKSGKNSSGSVNNLNGDVFSVAVLANQQLLYETGISSKKPVNMEEDFDVDIVLDEEDPPVDFGRRVDIVLENSSSGGEGSDLPTWVEVKSLNGKTAAGVPKDYTIFQGIKTSARKEFLIDCRAINANQSIGQEKMVDEALWWLQDFSKDYRGLTAPTQTELKTFTDRVQTLPKFGSRDISKKSVNAKGKKMCRKFPVGIDPLKLSVKTVILQNGRSILFDGVDGTLLQ